MPVGAGLRRADDGAEVRAGVAVGDVALKKPRSIAYLTSFVVTSRSTGGENFTPV